MNTLNTVLSEQQEQEFLNAFQFEELEERLETSVWNVTFNINVGN
jgi:hypothetical protein